MHPSNPSLAELFGGKPNTIAINHTNAMQLSAVYAAVSVLSNCIASVTWEVEGDPIYTKLLNVRPNQWMSAFDMLSSTQTNVSTRGNAYIEVSRLGDRIVSLFPIPAEFVEPQLVKFSDDTTDLYYKVSIPETVMVNDKLVSSIVERFLHNSDVIHIRNLGNTGYTGLDVIDLAEENLRTYMGAKIYGSRFYENSELPNGALCTDQVLKDETVKRLRDAWAAKHAGLGNAHRIAILEAGIKFIKTTPDPDTTQFLPAQKFQIEEVARFFNVPLHMLQHLERATVSNIGDLDNQFIKYCIVPWLKRFQQAFAHAMNKVVTYNVNELLYPLMTERYAAQGTAIRDGWKSRNEVRQEEGYDPVPGGGDLLLPINTSTYGGAPNV